MPLVHLIRCAGAALAPPPVLLCRNTCIKLWQDGEALWAWRCGHALCNASAAGPFDFDRAA